MDGEPKGMGGNSCGTLELNDGRAQTSYTLEVFIGDDFFIGRDKECLVTFNDDTISNHHLRVYIIGFDDFKPDIAPLIYTHDMSRNGTILLRSEDVVDAGFDLSKKILTRTDPPYLLSSGDELHLSPYASVKFRLHKSDRVCVNAREQVRRPEKKLFQNLYTITRRKIGEGGFGMVYLAFDRKNGSQLACKIIDVQALQEWECGQRSRRRVARHSGESPYQHIKQEVEILFELNHVSKIEARKTTMLMMYQPNILSIESVFFSECTAYIFTELVPAGDLMSYVQHRGGQLNDAGTAVIIRQILQAIYYLQSKKIVHRDLKPENILMTSLSEGARIVVSDFGHARYIPGMKDSQRELKSQAKLQRMFSIVGTLEYSAPEMFATQGIWSNSHKGYSNAIDMWSIGIITALLLSGRQPFGLDNESQLPEYEREKLIRENARNRNLDSLATSEGWQASGPRAKDFVMKLLVVAEDERLTAEKALRHPLFSNSHHRHEFEDLYCRATATWHPRPEGKARIVDLDLERRTAVRQDYLAEQMQQTPASPGAMEEDELSQDHEPGLGGGRSKYFA